MREVWAVVSDLHCGSTLGLCPPEGVDLDDGGRYTPSREQSALWSCWLDYWSQVGAALRPPDDKLIVALNGDAFDGDHHGTSQIISNNLPATHHQIALGALRPMLALEPAAIVVIRGTEVHVGKSAGSEERLARDLGAVESPAGNSSHWHFQAESCGVLVDLAHHGRLGQRPWTKATGPGTLAAQISLAAAKHGTRCPDLVIRSHYHQWADSFDNQACRVVQIGAWQLATAFVHRIAAGSLPEIGGLIVTCEGGEADVRKVKYPWKRSEPWHLSA